MKIIKVIILVLLVSLYSCEKDKYTDLSDGIYADIQTSVGDILVQLEYQDAPMTVGNFVSLADGTNTRVTDSLKGKPYYDGLNFHRVISKANGDSGDFMIQGGCPLGNGTGDPGYKFADEFPTDSVGGLLFKHDKPGMLSMANSGPSTNGSQFFITLVPTPHLDGKHTIFGHVIEGQGIIDSLVKTNTEIIKIDIIRVGSDANNFDANKAFDNEIVKAEELAKEKSEKIEKLKLSFVEKMEEFKSKAIELPSGLKVYFLNEGEGPKPEQDGDIGVHYSVFFTDGELLDTNRKELDQEYGIYNAIKEAQRGYEPFPAKYSMEGNLILGFKEGIQQMQFGDRVVLFIPSDIAYGEQGRKGVAPNTDLIFELEIYPMTE